jgi:hypothetical protein
VSLAKAVVLPNGNKILTFFGTKDLSLVKNLFEKIYFLAKNKFLVPKITTIFL